MQLILHSVMTARIGIADHTYVWVLKLLLLQLLSPLQGCLWYLQFSNTTHSIFDVVLRSCSCFWGKKMCMYTSVFACVSKCVCWMMLKFNQMCDKLTVFHLFEHTINSIKSTWISDCSYLLELHLQHHCMLMRSKRQRQLVSSLVSSTSTILHQDRLGVNDSHYISKVMIRLLVFTQISTMQQHIMVCFGYMWQYCVRFPWKPNKKGVFSPHRGGWLRECWISKQHCQRRGGKWVTLNVVRKWGTHFFFFLKWESTFCRWVKSDLTESHEQNLIGIYSGSDAAFHIWLCLMKYFPSDELIRVSCISKVKNFAKPFHQRQRVE